MGIEVSGARNATALAADPAFSGVYAPWPRLTTVPGIATAHVEVGSHTFTQNSSSYFGGYRSIITTADYVIWNLPFLAGSWSLDVEIVKAAAGGKFEVYINDVLVATIDTYDAGGGVARNTTTGITIATPGVYPVKFKAITRNPSSSSDVSRIAGFTVSLPGAL